MKTREVVINRCFGGFSLSHEGVMLYAKLSGFELYPFVDGRDENGHLSFDKHVPYDGGEAFIIHYSKKPLTPDGKYEEGSYFSDRDIPRDDKILVKVVKQLGKRADGRHAELTIVEIPANVEWEIDEYDGLETVEEAHRSWS